MFITGTDTGVGKTHVACAIVQTLVSRGVRVGVYKPAASGCEAGPAGPVWQDVELLSAASGGLFPAERICPQCFAAPLAPPIAARCEGRAVDEQLLASGIDWWRDRVDFLVVEGAGGLLSPLGPTMTVADLALQLGFPLLIVARNALGTLNHTLLSIEAAERRGLGVMGVIFNEPVPCDPHDHSIASNPLEISRYSPVAVLATLEHRPSSPASPLQPHPAIPRIDWMNLARGKT
jgi:dethiobiotin synthetase